jgi:hypothetical protein
VSSPAGTPNGVPGKGTQRKEIGAKPRPSAATSRLAGGISSAFGATFWRWVPFPCARKRAPAGERSSHSFVTSCSSRKKDGCRSKSSTASEVTAFCFQLATNTQGASSWTIACISL